MSMSTPPLDAPGGELSRRGHAATVIDHEQHDTTRPSGGQTPAAVVAERLASLPPDARACGFCFTVMTELTSARHRDYAFPFMAPVGHDVAPDYALLIAHPMDLGTIQHKLEQGDYNDGRDGRARFISHVTLVFDNCYAYGTEGTPIVMMAKKLQRVFDDLKGRLLLH